MASSLSARLTPGAAALVSQVTLRRMVYLTIKAMSTISEDVIMVTSSLMKDMTGDDTFRAPAIRALCTITDVRFFCCCLWLGHAFRAVIHLPCVCFLFFFVQSQACLTSPQPPVCPP